MARNSSDTQELFAVKHSIALAGTRLTLMDKLDWNFPFEQALHDVFPAVHDAQSAWMSSIDSLRAPDRKTHELIRLVVSVVLRNPAGVDRHAMLAREVGASWEEVLGSILLTTPGSGMLAAVEAIPVARARFESEPAAESD